MHMVCIGGCGYQLHLSLQWFLAPASWECFLIFSWWDTVITIIWILGVYTALTSRRRRQWGFSVPSLGTFSLSGPSHILEDNQIQFPSTWFQPISLCYIPWNQTSASCIGKNRKSARWPSNKGPEDHCYCTGTNGPDRVLIGALILESGNLLRWWDVASSLPCDTWPSLSFPLWQDSRGYMSAIPLQPCSKGSKI